MPHTIEHNDVNTDYFTSNRASGGGGGKPFNFISTTGAMLSEMSAWKLGWRIIGFEAKMSDGSTHFVGRKGGSKGTFTFRTGERITRLNLYASNDTHWRCLGAIGIRTDKGRAWSCYSSDLPDPNDGSYYPDEGSGFCCGIFGASGSDVDRLGFAMLRPINRAVLSNVIYPTLDLQIVASTPQTVAHQVFSNGTDDEQTFELSGSSSVTITREWGFSASFSFTQTTSVSAGIPVVAEVKTGYSWTVGATASYSSSTTEHETKSWKWPMVCPAHRKIVGDATMFADDINTDYTGDMELHLDTGKIYKFQEKGVYNGLNSRSDTVTITDLGPFTGTS